MPRGVCNEAEGYGEFELQSDVESRIAGWRSWRNVPGWTVLADESVVRAAGHVAEEPGLLAHFSLLQPDQSW